MKLFASICQKIVFFYHAFRFELFFLKLNKWAQALMDMPQHEALRAITVTRFKLSQLDSSNLNDSIYKFLNELEEKIKKA